MDQEEPTLPLYGVVGARRVHGGSRSGIIRAGDKPMVVTMSQAVSFVSEEGGSVSVTSHRGDDDERYKQVHEHVRTSVLMHPYLGAGEQGEPVLPESLQWATATIVVDDTDTAFQIANLGEGRWVAIGRVPGAIITIDSSGVPVSAVKLYRLTDDRVPPPPRPDLGEQGEAILDDLDHRFDRIPFFRVRRQADFWALLNVERDHIAKLAREQHLSAGDAKTLEQYWTGRIQAHPSGRLDSPSMYELRRSRARHLGHGFIFQLWFNTFGPGGRTWCRNRYVTIRRYSFRLRWRP